MRNPLRRATAALAMSLLAAIASACLATPQPGTKKVLEWGWDEPDPAFMRAHLAELESSPFDGVIYHLGYTTPAGKAGNFTWEFWGHRAFAMSQLAPGLADLRATPFRSLTDNFLRINATPADIGWFDDFSAVLTNARLAAAVARRGGSKGVCFDVEPYANRALWNYSKQADTTEHRWSGYAAQVRLRGAQFMQALQDSFPEVTVLLTLADSEPYRELSGNKTPFSRQFYGLLVPFVDGMVAAAHGHARIIDGLEGAYPIRDTTEFARWYGLMRGPMMSFVADSARFQRVVSYAFGIWMDFDWRNKGWSVVSPDSNYRPPAQLESIVRSALRASDEYVWLYSERPRWWSDERTTKDLPEAYVKAMWKARGRGKNQAQRPGP
jgi:hypothetical protein